MERTSDKLADLNLVSRYYPVANYSYPRKDCSTPISSRNAYIGSPCSSKSSRGRESLGSEGSAPGLVEDRTDSESSVDDDYQHHTHTSELWDSFWPGRSSSPKSKKSLPLPSKPNPTLIPPSDRERQFMIYANKKGPTWPLLSNSSPTPESRARTRKAAATYSAFPKLVSPPPTRSPPGVPGLKEEQIPQMPSPSCSNNTKPMRPPRPSEGLLAPCIRDPVFVPVSSGMADFAVHKDQHISPIATLDLLRPATPHDPRPSKSQDEGHFSCHPRCTIYSVVSHSATHLPVPEIRPSPIRTPRHFKSLAALKPPPQLEPEPHSIFEDDSDSEEEEEHGRKFFNFHKRSDSDHKRRRNRSNTTPAQRMIPGEPRTPKKDESRPVSSTSAHQKRHDVFGRLLGRRSR